MVVMARSLMYSVSMILCLHLLFNNSNSVFVVEFSRSHEDGFVMSPILQLFHISTFLSIKLRPIRSLHALAHQFFDFFHLSALTSIFFEEQ